MALYPDAVHRLLRWQFWTRNNAPWILGVMHITANPSKPPATASGEINWRLTDPKAGNSATYFIDRDGAIFQALDPGWQVAWTNGDLNNPDTSHPAIKRIVSSGINANRACYFTAELVGNEPNGYPITDAQVRSFAALLKFHAPQAKLPISRDTVLGHRHFNRSTRYNCPTSGNLEALLNRAITYATQEDDVPNAQPATWHPLNGSVSLKGGQTYNAFQFRGMADGKPVLERYNGIVYTSGTSARVIARAHWEAGAAERDSYLVSPFVWLPEHGVKDMLWWSRAPLPEPTVTLETTGVSPESWAALQKQAVTALRGLQGDADTAADAIAAKKP